MVRMDNRKEINQMKDWNKLMEYKSTRTEKQNGITFEQWIINTAEGQSTIDFELNDNN
jgi:hypothetical protein